MENSFGKMISISTGTIIRFVLVLILVFAFYLIRDVLLIVLTAIVLGSAVEPVTKWFMKKRIPRLPAVILIYLFLIAFLALTFYFFVPVLLGETSNFLSNIDSIDIAGSLQGSGFIPDDAKTFVQGFSFTEAINSIRQALSGLSQGFLGTVSLIFGGVVSFLLIIVLSFYFAVQEDGVADFLRVMVPVKNQQYVIDLWKRSQKKIGYWLQGQILLGVLVGVLIYLGLTVIGVKHALLLAFIAACFEIIPVFGPILSSIPGIAIAFTTGGVTLGLIVIGLYLIVQQFENHLIYPLVVNKVVGVSPIIVIVALLIGWKLGGFLGILLSVPVSAAIMEYFGDVKKDKLVKHNLA